jgi:hypothetical protein
MAGKYRSWERQVNEAIVESLLTLDRDNCVASLKEIASTSRQASWGLIQLGPAGVPAIVEILQSQDRNEMGPIYLIRQYIDNWGQVDRPIDRRFIEAVQENLDYCLGYSRQWTEYHQEFLHLAGVKELARKGVREIAEEFLAAVKANDQVAMRRVTTAASRSWPERLAKLNEPPHLQQLKIEEAYADVGDNLACVVAAAPGDENGVRVRIILNFISGSVWRVVNIATETRQIADRMQKPYLSDHPNAKLIAPGTHP